MVKKDGQVKRKLKCIWYADTKDVTLDDTEDELEFEPYDPEIKDVNELIEESKAAKIRKRGQVSYKCPL